MRNVFTFDSQLGWVSLFCCIFFLRDGLVPDSHTSLACREIPFTGTLKIITIINLKKIILVLIL